MFVYLSSLTGLVLGSFISALTWRLPRGLGFILGRSFCDNCKAGIFWYDNIPILSYMILKGRSSCCKTKISLRYPLIELAAALGFVFLYLRFGFVDIQYSIYYILFVLTLAVFVIDFENQIIPDQLSWAILFFSLLLPSTYPLVARIFAGFLYSLLMLLIHLITRGRGMGLGDVKLALGLGMALGLYEGLIWLFASFLTGGLVASILLISGKAKLKQKIAFGPFLILGFWIAQFL